MVDKMKCRWLEFKGFLRGLRDYILLKNKGIYYRSGHDYSELFKIEKVKNGYIKTGFLICKRCQKIDNVPTSVEFSFTKFPEES